MIKISLSSEGNSISGFISSALVSNEENVHDGDQYPFSLWHYCQKEKNLFEMLKNNQYIIS